MAPTSLTAEFRSLVRTHQSKLNIPTEQPKQGPLHAPDSFTQEAYRILKHLTNVDATISSARKQYVHRSYALSSRGKSGDSANAVEDVDHGSGMTDRDRELMDQQVKEVLNQCIARIRQLETIVKEEGGDLDIAADLDKGGVHAWLMNFDLDRSEILQQRQREVQTKKLLRAHRAAVAWFLNQRLAEISAKQREAQQVRLRRELERQKSSLDRASSFSWSNGNAPSPPSSRGSKASTVKSISISPANGIASSSLPSPPLRSPTELHIPEDQQQVLEQENTRLASELDATLDQVHRAHRALLEISELHSQMATHLRQQLEQTEKLYEEATGNVNLVLEGNTELTQAGKRMADTRKWVLFIMILASMVLLFLDWYD